MYEFGCESLDLYGFDNVDAFDDLTSVEFVFLNSSATEESLWIDSFVRDCEAEFLRDVWGRSKVLVHRAASIG